MKKYRVELAAENSGKNYLDEIARMLKPLPIGRSFP